MSSLQRRIAAVADTAANLIAQLSELNRLRESGQESTAIGPKIAANRP
jgi:hypothetical protein